MRAGEKKDPSGFVFDIFLDPARILSWIRLEAYLGPGWLPILDPARFLSRIRLGSYLGAEGDF